MGQITVFSGPERRLADELRHRRRLVKSRRNASRVPRLGFGVQPAQQRRYVGFSKQCRARCDHAAFDGGLVSFDDAGRVLVNPGLDDAARGALAVDHAPPLSLTDGHRSRLAWHRTRYGFSTI